MQQLDLAIHRGHKTFDISLFGHIKCLAAFHKETALDREKERMA
jgi:hypothetical protein